MRCLKAGFGCTLHIYLNLLLNVCCFVWYKTAQHLQLITLFQQNPQWNHTHWWLFYLNSVKFHLHISQTNMHWWLIIFLSFKAGEVSLLLWKNKYWSGKMSRYFMHSHKHKNISFHSILDICFDMRSQVGWNKFSNVASSSWYSQ